MFSRSALSHWSPENSLPTPIVPALSLPLRPASVPNFTYSLVLVIAVRAHLFTQHGTHGTCYRCGWLSTSARVHIQQHSDAHYAVHQRKRRFPPKLRRTLSCPLAQVHISVTTATPTTLSISASAHTHHCSDIHYADDYYNYNHYYHRSCHHVNIYNHYYAKVQQHNHIQVQEQAQDQEQRQCYPEDVVTSLILGTPSLRLP